MLDAEFWLCGFFKSNQKIPCAGFSCGSSSNEADEYEGEVDDRKVKWMPIRRS